MMIINSNYTHVYYWQWYTKTMYVLTKIFLYAHCVCNDIDMITFKQI